MNHNGERKGLRVPDWPFDNCSAPRFHLCEVQDPRHQCSSRLRVMNFFLALIPLLYLADCICVLFEFFKPLPHDLQKGSSFWSKARWPPQEHLFLFHLPSSIFPRYRPSLVPWNSEANLEPGTFRASPNGIKVDALRQEKPSFRRDDCTRGRNPVHRKIVV